MQVTSVKPFPIKSYNSNNYESQNNSPTFRAGYIGDIFIKGDLPIDKLKNFTLEEYHRLSKSEIASINEMIDNIIQNKSWNGNENFFRNNNGHLFNRYTKTWNNFNNFLKYHNIVATRLKNRLEEDYGVNNFMFISIGRSLSSICKCLGYKIGEKNVISLPMTSADRFCYPYDISRIKQKAINSLTDYMSSNGMSKKQVQTSGKKYIFADFCISGDSLEGAERLFKSDRMYGNNDNVLFVNIIKFLEYTGTKEFTIYNLLRILGSMEFKDLSVVNKCDNILKTVKSVEKPQAWDLLLKSFYFKFMDNEFNAVESSLQVASNCDNKSAGIVISTG